MARVDVLSEVVINQPADVVARFAGDPTNAPRWYRNIDSVTWLTEPPLRRGPSYAWTPTGDRTRMTLRNRGEPSGFVGMGAPLIVPAMRKANHEDLQALKRLLESS